MKIAIASDHGGFALKEVIGRHLEERGIPFEDFGTHSSESCDYPDFAAAACRAVTDGGFDCGILICSTGIGISMAANKVRGIRAALCGDCYSAKYTRLHNNANVLCLGALVVGQGLALQITDQFLDTPFEGGRHQRRVEKIMALENTGLTGGGL